MRYRTALKEFFLIFLGSVLYAIGTVMFVFPNGILLGGTSGVSVILTGFLSFSPGAILMIINLSLLLLSFFVLGRDMAVKTLVGSFLTTVFVGLLEKIITIEGTLISNNYLSALIGASVIAVASGVMFYVDSSSGGTDIIALIVRKFTGIRIGKALLITDILIVIVGGILSGLPILLSSFVGLLVKTLGIDLVISMIKKMKNKTESDPD